MNNQTTNNQQEEIFEIIPGFEKFAISNLGRIMKIKESNNPRSRAGSFKNIQVNKKTGYAHAKVGGSAGWRSMSVHKLVANAFIPNPLGLTEVDHINRNKLDNRVENLRWVTRRENMQNIDNRNCREVIAFPLKPEVRKDYPLEENFLRFDCISEAAEYLTSFTNQRFLKQGISNVVSNPRYTHYRGWGFQYVDKAEFDLGKED